jgi:recombination associated protein RdgC
MFFRNLCLLRFPTVLDFSDLDAQVAQAPLKPVGPLEMHSRGFINPFSRTEDVATHSVGDAIWVSVGGEDKILPGAVVNAELTKKLDAIEAQEGRRPGVKTRKRLKDELLHEMLPRAFVKPSRTDALIDAGLGFIAVDAGSRKRGEEVVSELRGVMGSFPALPINAVNAEVAPRSILTGWLAGEPLPEGLSLGEECQLADPIEGGAAVRCVRQEIRSEEIDKHLEAGKQCTHLALVLDDHISFVLGEDLVIRKLKFLDGALEALDNTSADDLRAELEANFALMAGEVRRLFLVLEVAFKLSRVDDGGAPQEGAQSAAARPAGAVQAGSTSAMLGADQVDPLLTAAREHVVTSRKSNISSLQTALKIGYYRAAWLLEALESSGVVSPPAADGRRKVLVSA